MKLKNIVFMGTPEFAVPTLIKLAESRFKPALCITQPDRPKGRKRKLSAPPIKQTAQEYNIPLIQPQNPNDDDTIAILKQLSPDIIVTAAYGGYLKKTIRLLPKFGCLNLHPSLLPKYRGAAPVNFTLFNNDKITGNTIFKIVAKMDAGPIIFQAKTKIEPAENYTSLLERLSRTGAKNVVHVLEGIEKNGLHTTPQDHTQATFTHKLKKDDFLLNWENSAEEIRNKVRGLAERPGAVSSFRGKRIKLIAVQIEKTSSSEKPGTVLEIKKNIGIVITTRDKNILLKTVQPAGKKIMSAHAFNLGAKIKLGEKFENGF